MKKLYVFDKENLKYKSLNLKNYFYILMAGFLLFSTFGFTTANFINSELEKIPVLIRINEQAFSPENLKIKLKELKLKHQDIIYAQAVLETNNFSSNIFKNNNNLFGMKCAMSRPTLHKGESFGHAQYLNWQECVIDYAFWQISYAKNLSREEYFLLLDKIYAEDPNYIKKLKIIIQNNK